MLKGLRKWEAALLAGVLAGLLAAPAGAAEPLALSRWAASEGEAPRYQVCLFPFGVGEVQEPERPGLQEQAGPEYEIRFRLLDWWEEIRSARGG